MTNSSTKQILISIRAKKNSAFGRFFWLPKESKEAMACINKLNKMRDVKSPYIKIEDPKTTIYFQTENFTSNRGYSK